MSDAELSEREYGVLLRSIESSNKTTTDCLQKLTESVVKIEKYIIHNDYRHTATEGEIRIIKKDMSSVLQMMEARSGMWRAFKKGKWIIGLISAGMLTAAGTGVYNYLAKPQPVINQNKELTVKPGIKVIK